MNSFVDINKRDFIENKLKKNAHKNFFTHSNGMVSYHNSKDNAIVMLMAMAEFSDEVSLSYDKWKEEFMVEVTLHFNDITYENK